LKTRNRHDVTNDPAGAPERPAQYREMGTLDALIEQE
jgi:hypothetical protein